MRNPSKSSFFSMMKSVGFYPTVVVDVGVHQHGTPDLMNSFSESFHLLIEPVKEFSPYIERLYQGHHHKIYNIGLSNIEGFLELEKLTIDGSSEITHSHLLQGNLLDSGDIGNSYRVPVRTLKWLASQHPEIASNKCLLKLDVDGLELEILKGAGSSLAYYDLIVIEMPVRFYKDRFLYLLQNDFYLLDILDPCYYKGFLSQVDMAFASHHLLQAIPALTPWGKDDFHWRDYEHWTPD